MSVLKPALVPPTTTAPIKGPRWPSAADRARLVGSKAGAQLKTGFETLDKATRGGFRAGQIVILGGAPGAGKTTLVSQLAFKWAQAGHSVSMFACDETVDGLLIRFGQSVGLSREALEAGAPEAIRDLVEHLMDLPNLDVIDADETGVLIEHVSADLQRRRPEGGASILIADSVQTTRAEHLDSADGPRAKINLVMEVLKRCAKVHGHLVLATCELARGAYRSQNAADRIDDLAAFKESGGIEYGATMALVLRSVPGDGGLVDVTIPKNRAGQKLPFRLSLDSTPATFSEVEIPSETAPAVLDAVRERVLAVVAAAVVPIKSKNELARRAKRNKKQVCQAIDELLEEGLLEIAKGTFKAVNKGAEQ